MHLKRIGCLFLALFISVTLIYLFGGMDAPDYFLSDLLYQNYRVPDPRIFVIGIDAHTLDYYGPWNSWPRTRTADLLNLLNADPDHKPAVIGLDILFSGQTTQADDEALVEAVRNGGNVVLAAQVEFAKELVTVDGQRQWDYSNIGSYEPPFDALAQLAPSGITNMATDRDGLIRKNIQFLKTPEGELPSFTWQIYKAYSEKMGLPLNYPPVNENGITYISFAGEPGEFFGTAGKGTSWLRVMNGEIPAALFEDAIVLIGPYAPGMTDSYLTAAKYGVPMFGVEIHANILQNLLESRFKRYLHGTVEIVICFLLSLAMFLLFCKFSVKLSTLFMLAFCLAYLGSAALLFRMGFIITIFYPIVMVIIAYLGVLIAKQISLTLERARLYVKLDNLLRNSFRTLASTIDAKDPCTSGHCQRVSQYALMIGKALKMSDDDLSDLEYTALLHDVGKIGVPDAILKKQGSLTDEEYAEMKQHPEKGGQILSKIEEFNGRIAEGARYHHERYDGKGYGQGLKGDEIPLFARIISVADAYDAMTQNRPYRGRMSREDALTEMRRNIGTQFDPQIAQLFIDLIQSTPHETYEQMLRLGDDSELPGGVDKHAAGVKGGA